MLLGLNGFLHRIDTRSFSLGDGGLLPALWEDAPLLRPWGPRLRENDDRLLPAVDMWTSGADMLPVLLEELKSASLPGFMAPPFGSFL